MPSEPGEWLILQRIQTVIQGITEANGYWFDLSGADRVVIGEAALLPDVLPFAAIGWSQGNDRDGNDLGRYYSTDIIAIVCRAPYSDATLSGRTLAALRLQSDLRKALETDRTLGGLVRALVVTARQDLVGDEPELDQQSVGIGMLVQVERQRPAGGR